ncbi:MAG TPA: DUF368 domain-containing protein [Candidatus Aphodoplasma excrementigallinarum]|uniref:DUF368 domain-containing protein n=1 Tax=Candidatus Aphodoplasma excrementigallinarum TaxID=2840673 RepID=A0A9D1T013_9FIRM|nr:DUF368 domain-containing protein [Candidatus Aphodoplasma excrementigallinarum]
MRSVIINFLKSIVIGASAFIPGISGGTMAIALGVYDRLLRCVSHFKDNMRQNAAYLTVFAVGASVGLLTLSGWVLWMFNTYRLPMIYLFIGCVFGSIPMLFRRGGVSQIGISDTFWVLAGYLCITWVAQIPAGSCLVGGIYVLNFLMLMAAGVIVAIAFILPGISTSYILLLLGIYDISQRAVQSWNFAFLVPLILGVLAGTLITTRILEDALERHRKQTYMLIVGFVLGSIFEIIPGFPMGYEIIVCVLTFAAGFLAVKLILRYSEEF